MSYCCCSLAGTVACRTCSNNPNAETPPPVRTNTIVLTDDVLVTMARNKSESGFLCSLCGFGDFGGFHGYQPNFCPNCGAKMGNSNETI